MRSLQSRLGIGLLLSLIVCFSSLWLLVSINTEYLAEEYIASRIKHDSDTLINAIDFDSQGKLVIDASRVDLVYNQPFSGHYYVINTDTQTINSRSLWDHTLETEAINPGEQFRFLRDGPEEQTLLVVSSGYRKQDHQFSIAIAEDLQPIKSNIKEFQYWFSIMAFGMLIVLVLLQVFILRRSLKPLEKTQTELMLLEQGQLDKLSTDAPDELRPLIDEINHLLLVMKQRLRRSRDATSDLAHAIKKPLTVIQQLTENSDIDKDTRNTLTKQSNDIYQLTDRILKRARLAGHSHSGTVFSFSKDLPALIKTLDMMYAEKSPVLTCNIPDKLICPIDREDMLELLGNLLDNAYKWSEQQILFTINHNTRLHISIEDDGQGTDAEKLSQLAKRGIRLDEKTQGHGFGLAIAADIIRDLGGEISFSSSNQLGGFKVDVSLPLKLDHI